MAVSLQQEKGGHFLLAANYEATILARADSWDKRGQTPPFLSIARQGTPGTT
jgi:hypothetical protein